jgi:hypothetical protein
MSRLSDYMDDQVSARTLASLLRVTDKTISELAKRGIIAPAGCGRYALEASVKLLRVSPSDGPRSRWERCDGGGEEVEHSVV